MLSNGGSVDLGSLEESLRNILTVRDTDPMYVLLNNLALPAGGVDMSLPFPVTAARFGANVMVTIHSKSGRAFYIRLTEGEALVVPVTDTDYAKQIYTQMRDGFTSMSYAQCQAGDDGGVCYIDNLAVSEAEFNEYRANMIAMLDTMIQALDNWKDTPTLRKASVCPHPIATEGYVNLQSITSETLVCTVGSSAGLAPTIAYDSSQKKWVPIYRCQNGGCS